MIHKSAVARCKESPCSIWECPAALSADKAREAIRWGMEAEAGLRLVWKDGPLEVEEVRFVREADWKDLRAFYGGAPGGNPWSYSFWSLVREIRSRKVERPTWEALLGTVNEITGAGYSLQQLKGLLGGQEGLPVHERRLFGPVDLVALHRSHALTFNPCVPHKWDGGPKLREDEDDHGLCVVVAVYANKRGLPGVIPRSRQIALAYADVHSVSLSFTPLVRVGRTRMFQDQEGNRRRGRRYEIMFPATGSVGPT